MNIVWHTPYKADGSERYPDPVWPYDWPLPHVGSIINFRNGDILWVGAIDFNPEGDGDDSDPFIYIVLQDKPR